MKNLLLGRWRIVETESWAQEDLDLVGPAHMVFEKDGLGEMHFIALDASIDYRVVTRDDTPCVEFTWSGHDEGDPTSGRGHARIEGQTLVGQLFFHHGDESQFVAKKQIP